MVFNMYNCNLFSLMYYSICELCYLFDLFCDFKCVKYIGIEQQYLKCKNIVLIFEKIFICICCVFEVVVYDQGVNVIYIDLNFLQIGYKESMKDIVWVFGWMYDVIEYCGFKQEIVEEFVKFVGVLVFNGLIDEYYLIQMFVDVLIMCEYSDKLLYDISYVYLGDVCNNMGNFLLLIGVKFGMDVCIVVLKVFWLYDEFVVQCKKFVEESGVKLIFIEDLKEVVKGVDFVYIDVWVLMGELVEVWGEWIKELLFYQVNMEIMKVIGNLWVKFMYCLLVFYNSEIKVGKQIVEQYLNLVNGIEVIEDVFELFYNIVFEQVENCMYIIKVIFVLIFVDI